MNELLDNAPNHNYYVSLIVNYKRASNWVAKVAFMSEVEEVGESTKTFTFKGLSGIVNKVFKEPKKTKKTIMFTADFTIELESDVFRERILKLSEPKVKVFDYTNMYGSYGKSVTYGGKSLNNPKNNARKPLKTKNKQLSIGFNLQYNEKEYTDFNTRTLDNFDIIRFLNVSLSKELVKDFGKFNTLDEKLKYLNQDATIQELYTVEHYIDSNEFLMDAVEFIKSRKSTANSKNAKKQQLDNTAIDIFVLSLFKTLEDLIKKNSLLGHAGNEVDNLLNMVLERINILISSEDNVVNLDDAEFKRITNFELKDAIEFYNEFNQISTVETKNKVNSEKVVVSDEVEDFHSPWNIYD